ncbi:MAG: hypothetical protein E6J17_10680, partial [Chloroflexi bacterium]
QTTFNNGRAVIAAATEVREQLLDLAADLLEANRADLELVDGAARVKGSRTVSVSIAELAAQAAAAGLLLGKGSGEPPPTPAVEAASCVGRLGAESFAAPTFFTHAIRVKTQASCGPSRSRRPTSPASSSTRSGRPARSTVGWRWGSARHSARAFCSRRTAGSATRICSTTSSRQSPTFRPSTSTSSTPRRRPAAPRASRASPSHRVSLRPALSRMPSPVPLASGSASCR